MQIYGMTYVLVDAPKLPTGKVVTKFDEKQPRHSVRTGFSFAPHEVIDWVTDAFGNFAYIKRVQDIDEFKRSRF
jgi:hypothetical protein